jgi:hypothetical protein
MAAAHREYPHLAVGGPIQMSTMIPFRYSGFWDVPRHILLNYQDTWLFLYSRFDESLDEYSDSYLIYRLPDSLGPRLENESWAFVFDMLHDCIGTLKVHDITFDETRRNTLDSKSLENLEMFQKD